MKLYTWATFNDLTLRFGASVERLRFKTNARPRATEVGTATAGRGGPLAREGLVAEIAVT